MESSKESHLEKKIRERSDYNRQKKKLEKIRAAFEANRIKAKHEKIFNDLFVPGREFTTMMVRKSDRFKKLLSICNQYGKTRVSDKVKSIECAELIKTPYWQVISEQIKRKDGFTCCNCGSHQNLVAHYLTMSNYGCELSNLDNLACLCSHCQKNIEKSMKEIM